MPRGLHAWSLSWRELLRWQLPQQWLREDCGGNWYREKTTGMEGWLCPALLRYFEIAPKRLYLAALTFSLSDHPCGRSPPKSRLPAAYASEHFVGKRTAKRLPFCWLPEHN